MEYLLSDRIGLKEVKEMAADASDAVEKMNLLWNLSFSADRTTSVNCLWVMTHLGTDCREWLQSIQETIIDRLLTETDTSKKRIFLQLLKEQEINPDSPLAARLLDYCFYKINSESEPYAVRCFSIYVAFNICRRYPELISELEQYLNLLSSQTLSPGLKSALRQTRNKISTLRKMPANR